MGMISTDYEQRFRNIQPYQFTLHLGIYPLITGYETVREMKSWCTDNFGQAGGIARWRFAKHNLSDIGIYFKNEKDAALFKFIWFEKFGTFKDLYA